MTPVEPAQKNNGHGQKDLGDTRKLAVAVVNENEPLVIGLRACIESAPGLFLADISDERLSIAVVSPEVARTQPIPCPLVVCGDLPGDPAPGNRVRGTLPMTALTAEHVIASVHAVAAGLQVSFPAPSPSEVTTPRAQQAPFDALPQLEGRSRSAEADAPGERPLRAVRKPLDGGTEPGEAEKNDPVSLEAAIKAISDPQRRRILALLSEGELAAGDIAQQFDVSRPAISQHLQVLKDTGLVLERREKTRRLYRVRVDGLRPVEGFLDEILPTRLGISTDGPVVGPAKDGKSSLRRSPS